MMMMMMMMERKRKEKKWWVGLIVFDEQNSYVMIKTSPLRDRYHRNMMI